MPKFPFIFGALLAAIGWAIAWPERKPQLSMVTPPARKFANQPEWSPERLSDLVDHLKDSQDTKKQRAAARELEGLKRSEIHDLLLGMKGEFDDVWNFPVAAKLLLVELARRDPAEAVAWSWENLRHFRAWAHAFEQIGPQWAWDDAEGFSEFVKKHLREGAHERDLTMKELLATSEPVLSDDEANDAQLWLLKSSPRSAFQILRLSGSTMKRAEMIEALNSASDCEAALGAWDDYDPQKERVAREAHDAGIQKLRANEDDDITREAARELHRELAKVRHPSGDYTVREIVKRWKLLDPESFAESPYVEWEKMMKN